jgi:hypothetical protein
LEGGVHGWEILAEEPAGRKKDLATSALLRQLLVVSF